MNYTIGKKTTPPEERELSEKTLAVAVSETEIQFGEVIEIAEKETPGVLQNISMLSTTTQTSEPEAPDFAGVQFTNPQNGYYNMRLVSQIKTLNYQSLGYEIHSKYGNDAPVSQILFSKTAYTSLNADGTTLYPSEGFDYFVVNVIENIPENTIASFIIKPFAITLEGQCLYGSTKTFSSKNAQLIDYVAFEAPAPGLKTIKQCRIRKEMSMDDSAILKDSSGTNVKLNVGDTVPLLSPTTISANGRVWYRILYNGMMLYVTADDESFKEVYVSAPQVPTGRDIIANPGVGSNIKIRSTPTEVNGNIIAQVAHGTNLTLTCSSPQNQTWYAVYVQLSNGTYSYGWCSGKYLAYYILKTIKDCYVRTAMTISSSTILKNSSGKSVVLRANTADSIRLWKLAKQTGGEYDDNGKTRNDWYMVEYNGQIAYVTADSFNLYAFGEPLVGGNNPSGGDSTVMPDRASDKCLEFIIDYEGKEFLATARDDGYGNLTIGYGHVVKSGESFGTITKQEALELFSQDISSTETMVKNYSKNRNRIWSQQQYDAFVSLAYNAGSVVASVMDEIISGIDPYEAFSKICHANGEFSLGLYRRRMDEADIFVHGEYQREYRNAP